MAEVEGDLAYAEHTAVTRPGRGAALVRDLPHAVEELVPLVRSVLVHHTRVPGFTAGSDRCDDGTELRPVQAVLDAVAALDPAPWTLPRPSRRQLVVDCRSSAVLLCSALREIDLEYFQEALRLMIRLVPSPRVPVSVIGMSRGSEAALLTAVHSPELVDAVVAAVPSNVVTGSWPPGGPAWLLNGRPCPMSLTSNRPVRITQPSYESN